MARMPEFTETDSIDAGIAISADQIRLARNALPHISEIEDSAELEVSDQMGRPTYHSHRQLFVPTIIILCLYSGGLLVLWSIDMTSSALFRMFALVLGIGVPLLGAHAFLRYETVRLQFLKDRLRVHPGWPKDAPIEIPYDLVSSLKVKRGLSGRLFGGGTIIIELTTGSKIAIADLKRPLDALAEYQHIVSER